MTNKMCDLEPAEVLGKGLKLATTHGLSSRGPGFPEPAFLQPSEPCRHTTKLTFTSDCSGRVCEVLL